MVGIVCLHGKSCHVCGASCRVGEHPSPNISPTGTFAGDSNMVEFGLRAAAHLFFLLSVILMSLCIFDVLLSLSMHCTAVVGHCV